MELPIPKELEKLWDKWEIPACVLLSLLLQVFLVLFAPWRRRSRNPILLFLIWSAYLIADWIAAVTIGLITKVQTQNGRHGNSQDLYAFWASFLLLHLGGPDSITSFALEDNEFWLRHLFGLILQVMSAGYCIFLTLPNNKLWLPTILIFVVGSIKYAERTTALYLASLSHFGDAVSDSDGPDVEGTEFDFKLAPESDHMDLLMLAYSLFKFFKGTIGGLLLSSKLIESSENLFSQIKNPNVGFKLVEYELSFMYEILHTKVSVVRSRIGFTFRLSSIFLIFGAFLLFHFEVVKDNNKDHEFGGFELSLAYALLIGAIGLDTISGISLMFSDWILVSNNGLIKRWRKCIPRFILKRRRWCGSVPQYNMIDYCLDERWIWKFNKLPHCFRVIIDNIKFMLFSSSSSVDDFEQLKRYICKELTNPTFSGLDRMMSSENDKADFAQVVLVFHLGTEIRYHQWRETEDQERNIERRMNKMISDYMFYLLIMKPEMMGSSAKGEKWKKIFQDTFAEAKSQLMRCKIYDYVQACNHFMDYHKPDLSTSSKSLLSKAAVDYPDGPLWIALLCSVAIKCRPMLHAQQPSRGGELLTFTLFLTQHLGLIPGMRPERIRR